MSQALHPHEQRIRTIQDHNQEITHITAAQVEFAGLFSEEETDTLIWLRLSTTISKLTCDGICYPQEWLLPYSSAPLRSSGFGKFAKLLDNERYQQRQLHSLRSSGHAVPSGVRYVLDLGPSAESELRSEHLEALTLPKGIVQYSMMTDLTNEHKVPVCVAGGHDDACRCFEIGISDKRKSQSKNAATSDSPSEAADTSPGGESDGDSESAVPLEGCIWDLPLTPERRIDDYCEVRHAANVIRLLLALVGYPLLLNSAARVYTICGLAKLFGASGNNDFLNRLRSQVHEWFFVKNNTTIVDTLPEECFRMAWNIQLPNVARAAFRILVAERALCDAGDSSQPRTYQRQKTPFGRELSGLDEDLETLLDHASGALTCRIGELLTKLQSPNKLDLLDVPQYYRLRDLERVVADAAPQTSETEEALAAIRRLADTYQGILSPSLLCGPLPILTKSKFPEMAVGPLNLYVRQKRSLMSFFKVYNELAEKQKQLTAVYWGFLACTLQRRLDSFLRNRDMDGLVRAANAALRKALVQDREGGGQDLTSQLARLDVAIFFPSAVFRRQDPFSIEAIDKELYGRTLAGAFAHLYDRHSFVPDFELGLVNPSPHLLLGLSENEFRFLPLWAGGQDDGTGAVFQDELPTAQLGPTGPGPAYHTGTTQAGTTADTMSMATLPASDFGTATEIGSDQGAEHTESSFVLVQDLNRLALDNDDGGVDGPMGVALAAGSCSTFAFASSESSFVDVGRETDAMDQAAAFVYDLDDLDEDDFEGFDDDDDDDEDYDDDDDDIDTLSDITVTQNKEDKNDEIGIGEVEGRREKGI